MERCQSRLSYVRLHRLQGGDEVGQEARRVIVAFVLKTLRVHENTFEKHDFGHPKNPFVTGSPENP